MCLQLHVCYARQAMTLLVMLAHCSVQIALPVDSVISAVLACVPLVHLDRTMISAGSSLVCNVRAVRFQLSMAQLFVPRVLQDHSATCLV
jgi:hypothetical protein